MSSLPNNHFNSSNPTNSWWPKKFVGVDPVADAACEQVIEDLLNGKTPSDTHVAAAGQALANHFYFTLTEVGEPHEGGGLAFNLTPVRLWEEKKDYWSQENGYETVLENFSEEVLPRLFKAKSQGINPYQEWGAGCFIFNDQSEDEMFKHLSECGFSWGRDIQKAHYAHDFSFKQYDDLRGQPVSANTKVDPMTDFNSFLNKLRKF